jgi:hypothetical protein
MRPLRMLLLLLGLWLIAPAPASALEVSFSDAGNGDLVSAIDSSPVKLELVRGGKVLVTAGPNRTARVGRPLQAGDVARVTLDGGEVRTFTWEGLPALDADTCASLGQQTVTGSFPAGAALFGSLGESEVGFTLDGTRFTARLPQPLTAGENFSMEARRTEGGALVRYLLFIEVCPSAVPPRPPEGPNCSLEMVENHPAYFRIIDDSVRTLGKLGPEGLRARMLFRAFLVCSGTGRLAIKVKTRDGRLLARAATSFKVCCVGRINLWLKPTKLGVRMSNRGRVAGVVRIAYTDPFGQTARYKRSVVFR